MSAWIKDGMARSFKCPQQGLFGYFALRVFKKHNDFLEESAARLCNIQPHHNVLEVGFGPGLGIKAAHKYVKDGTGRIYGIEYSDYMVVEASRHLKKEIKMGKVDLSLGTVLQMPYNTDSMDCVFHVNCYYFWPSMRLAMRELYRVMKPGSVMVTTMEKMALQCSCDQGWLKYAYTDPVKYMDALEKYGFGNVRFEYMNDSRKRYEAIFAEITEKPAHRVDQEEEEMDKIK